MLRPTSFSAKATLTSTSSETSAESDFYILVLIIFVKASGCLLVCFFMENIEDVMFAQRLAGNDKAGRDKALRKVRMYISSSPSELTESSFMKIWKGLYYCMYMADKPLVQEDVAENTSLLLHQCRSSAQKLLFFKCALATFAREWEGIDKFRINKFMMLFCRVLRQILVHLKSTQWNESEVGEVASVLETAVISPSDNTNKVPLGLKIHLSDILLDELAKIGQEELPHRVILAFIYPYIKVLLLSNSRIYMNNVKRFVIQRLIDQSDAVLGSEEDEEDSGQEDNDAEGVAVSEQNGMGLTSPVNGGEVDSDSEGENDGSEEEDGEVALDPRAGGVDVILPQLKPDYGKIADVLMALGSIQSLSGARRREIYSLVKTFRAVSQGIDPLPQVEPFRPNKAQERKRVNKSLVKMKKFEEALMEDEEMGRSESKQKVYKKHFGVPNGSKKRSLEELQEEDSEVFAVQKGRPKKKKMVKKVKKVPKKPADQVKKVDLASEINSKMMTIAERVDFPFSFREEVIEKDSSVGPIKKRRKKRRNRKASGPDGHQAVVAAEPASVAVGDQTKDKKLKKRKLKSVLEADAKEEKILPKAKVAKLTKLAKGNLKGSSTLAPEVVQNSPAKTTNLTKKKKKSGRPILSKGGLSSLSSDKDKQQKVEVNPINENCLKNSSNSPINNPSKKQKISKGPKNKDQLQEKKVLGTKSQTNKPPIKAKILTKPKITKKLAQVSKTPNRSEPSRPQKLRHDPWSEPLKDGEIEIVITKKKKTARKSAPPKQDSFEPSPTKTPNSRGKTLAINLARNVEHDVRDYERILTAKPQIPFSSLRKPKGSVLKKSRSPMQKPLRSSSSAVAKFNPAKKKLRRGVPSKKLKRVSVPVNFRS